MRQLSLIVLAVFTWSVVSQGELLPRRRANRQGFANSPATAAPTPAPPTKSPAPAPLSAGDKALEILLALHNELPTDAQEPEEMAAQRGGVMKKLEALNQLMPDVLAELKKGPNKDKKALEELVQYAEGMKEFFKNTKTRYANDSADPNYGLNAGVSLKGTVDDFIAQSLSYWYQAAGLWSADKATQAKRFKNPNDNPRGKLLEIRTALRNSALTKAQREPIELLLNGFEEKLTASGCLGEAAPRDAKTGTHR